MDHKGILAGGEPLKTEFLLQNKATGKIWEISNCVQTASCDTERSGSPGKFTFTLNANGGIGFI